MAFREGKGVCPESEQAKPGMWQDKLGHAGQKDLEQRSFFLQRVGGVRRDDGETLGRFSASSFYMMCG